MIASPGYLISPSACLCMMFSTTGTKCSTVPVVQLTVWRLLYPQPTINNPDLDYNSGTEGRNDKINVIFEIYGKFAIG